MAPLSKGAFNFASVAEQVVAAKARAAILSRPVDPSPSRFLADFQKGYSGEVKVFPLTKEGDLEAIKAVVGIAFEVKQKEPGKLQLWYVTPFCTNVGERGPREDWLLLDSQPLWEECIADLPWSDRTRLSRLAAFALKQLSAGDVKFRQEALHFTWELAVNRNRHSAFSPDLLSALLSALTLTGEPGAKATCLLSLVTIWSLSVSAGLRRQLITLGAIERLLVLLEQLKEPLSAAAVLSNVDQRRLRECVMRCFSVFLCDAQARARMYVPDAQELGLDVTGATGWAMLTSYAQLGHEPGSVPQSSRTARELAAEALCTVLWRDHLGFTIFLRTGGIGHLLRMMRSDSAYVQRCAVGAVWKCTGTESGRAALLVRGRELAVLFSALVSLLRNVSKRQRRKSEKELHHTVAEGAAAAIWGAVKCALAGKLQSDASDLASFFALIAEGRRGLSGCSAMRFLAAAAALLAADAASASRLTLVNAQVPLGMLAAASDESAATAAAAALALLAEQEARIHKDGWVFRGQLDGPHRVHLLKSGALTSLVTSASRYPQNVALCQAAAAGIMYLAGPAREATQPDLHGIVRLVESSDPRTSLYASCALWGFARNLRNRAEIGRVNGIQALINAGRRVLESVQSKPSLNPPDPANIKALECILATVWLLLTHESNRHYLERAAQYVPAPQKPSRDSNERGVRLTIHSNPASPRRHTRDSSSSINILFKNLSGILESRISEDSPDYEEREGREDEEQAKAGEIDQAGELGQLSGNDSPSNRAAALSKPAAIDALPSRRIRPSSANDSPSTGIFGGPSLHGVPSPARKDLHVPKSNHAKSKKSAEGDVFSQLLDRPPEIVPGLQRLPSTGLTAEVGGLDFLVSLIVEEGILEDRAWDTSKYLAVKALKFSTQTVLEFEKRVIDLNIGPALASIAKNPDASEGLRKVCARYCQGLSGLGRNAELFGLGNESVLEEVLINLLRSGKQPLEERGARGCAHVAMYRENKERLARLGAIEALADLAKKTESQDILALVMAALLNLSTSPALQVPICKTGLYVVLSANRAQSSSDEVRRFSTGVLLNLCQHPDNRTRMYKAELRLKALDAEASADPHSPRSGQSSPDPRDRGTSLPTPASTSKSLLRDPRRSTVPVSKHLLEGSSSHSGPLFDFEKLGPEDRLRVLREWSSSMKENREQLAAAAQGFRRGSSFVKPEDAPMMAGGAEELDEPGGSAGAIAAGESAAALSQGSGRISRFESTVNLVAAAQNPRRSNTALERGVSSIPEELERSWSVQELRGRGGEELDTEESWSSGDEEDDLGIQTKRRFVEWMRETWHAKRAPRRLKRNKNSTDLEEYRACFVREEGTPKAVPQKTDDAGAAESPKRSMWVGSAQLPPRIASPSPELKEAGGANVARPRRATDLPGLGGSSFKSPFRGLSVNKQSFKSPGSLIGTTSEGARMLPPVTSRSPTRSPTPTGRQFPAGRLMHLQRSLTRPVAEIWAGGKKPGAKSPLVSESAGDRLKAPGNGQTGWQPEIGAFQTEGDEAVAGHSTHPDAGVVAPRTGAGSPSPPKTSLTAIVDPDRPRNRVRFDNKLRAETNPLVEHLDMFTHLEGCTFCKALYSHYTLPDGTMAHFFQHGKRLVDEVEIPLERPSDPPVTFEDILQAGLPGPAPILRELTEIPPETLPKPFTPAPCLAPKPSRHLLPVVEHDCPNNDPAQCPRHGELYAANPLFVLEENTQPSAPASPRESEHKHHPDFKISRSIFGPRKKECDARSYFHHTRLEDRIFDTDWTRVVNKTRFVKTLGTAADVTRLRGVLRAHFRNIMGVFDYFGTLGPSEPFAIQLREYDMWLTRSKIPDEASASCKLTDCERVFISSNYEYDKNSLESEINDDNSLTRFEFIEALIRLAIAKFGDGIHTQNTAEAVEKLLLEHVFRYSPVELDVDLNVFRKNQLYRLEIDGVFRAHETLLRAVFGYYKGIRTMPAAPGKFMELPHWLDFVTDVRLLDPNHGSPETKALYLHGRMLVADELLDHDRAVSCTFIDFLEMLARMAALKHFPGDFELERQGFTGAHKLHAYLLASTAARHFETLRAHAAHVAAASAPDHARTSEFIDVIPSDANPPLDAKRASDTKRLSDGKRSSDEGRFSKDLTRSTAASRGRSSDVSERRSSDAKRGNSSSVDESKRKSSVVESARKVSAEDTPGEVEGRPLHERLSQLLDLIFFRLMNLHAVKDAEHLRKKLVAAVKV